MSENERPRPLEEMAEAHLELGCWRQDGEQYRVLCGFCKTWCDARVTMIDEFGQDLEGEHALGVVYDLDQTQGAVIQLHVKLRLHIHGHECPSGRDTILSVFG